MGRGRGCEWGSRAGPGATSSGPSAGGIGSSVFRTARRSARAGFIVAVGVMVVVSHAARNARPNKPMISLMIKWKRRPAGCYHYHLLIASGKVLRRRLRGLTESRPTNTSSAKISSVGRRSAEPPSKRDRFSYKKRSMIGPSLLIVAAGHNFRSVMIALSRA